MRSLVKMTAGLIGARMCRYRRFGTARFINLIRGHQGTDAHCFKWHYFDKCDVSMLLLYCQKVIDRHEPHPTGDS